MAEVTHPIVVIGSSAGGWTALPTVLQNLPHDFQAAVFIVQHMPSDSMGIAFQNHLASASMLPCAFAIDGEPIRPGRVYLTPPDHHLLLTENSVRITKGPRENSFRPSIDTLFRSAAAHHTSGVIGILLSGMRDDGVEGLASVARCGGITMVQDPSEAPFPDMPQNALNLVSVDYTILTVEMGLVLSGLIYKPGKTAGQVPEDVRNEATIAERVLTSLEDVEQMATGTGFTCPSCGGVLWDVNHDNKVHSYRCHAGHAFSSETLLQLKGREVEETMWAALRLMEEQKRMLTKFPHTPAESNSIQLRVTENQRYINILRSLLLNGTPKENGASKPS